MTLVFILSLFVVVALATWVALLLLERRKATLR